VEAALHKDHPVGEDPVADSVFMGQPARPGVEAEVAQRFRFPDAREWVAAYCVDDIQHPQSDLSVCSDPLAEFV